MKIVDLKDAPIQVIKALEHVKSVFPSVTQVSYDDACRWVYRTDSGFPPMFTDDIDIGILNEAADAVYNIAVPVLYKQID